MKTIKILSIAFTVCLALLACGGGDGDEPSPTPTPTPTPPTPTVKGKHLTKVCNMPADASEQLVELTGLTSEATHKGGVAKWLTTTLSATIQNSLAPSFPRARTRLDPRCATRIAIMQRINLIKPMIPPVSCSIIWAQGSSFSKTSSPLYHKQ